MTPAIFDLSKEEQEWVISTIISYPGISYQCLCDWYRTSFRPNIITNFYMFINRSVKDGSFIQKDNADYHVFGNLYNNSIKNLWCHYKKQ